MTLEELNRLPVDEVRRTFLNCCASSRWAEQMAAALPLPDRDRLFEVAGEIWNSLSPEDWLEAFAGHPQIGERPGHTGSETVKQWSAEEQRGVEGASGVARTELARLNAEYRDTFGFIFLVCATGKNTSEILDLLRTRLGNDPREELLVAANEQRLITEIRLAKLFGNGE